MQRARIVTVVHVTVEIVRDAMVADLGSRARNRCNRSHARNVANKVNPRRSKNRLKSPQAPTVQNANVRAVAEGAVIEVIGQTAKRNPPAKPSLH